MKTKTEIVGYIGKREEGKTIIQTIQKTLAKFVLSEQCKEYNINKKIKVTITIEE